MGKVSRRKCLSRTKGSQKKAAKEEAIAAIIDMKTNHPPPKKTSTKWRLGISSLYFHVFEKPHEREWGGRNGTITLIQKLLGLAENQRRMVRHVLEDCSALDNPTLTLRADFEAWRSRPTRLLHSEMNANNCQFVESDDDAGDVGLS